MLVPLDNPYSLLPETGRPKPTNMYEIKKTYDPGEDDTKKVKKNLLILYEYSLYIGFF